MPHLTLVPPLPASASKPKRATSDLPQRVEALSLDFAPSPNLDIDLDPVPPRSGRAHRPRIPKGLKWRSAWFGKAHLKSEALLRSPESLLIWNIIYELEDIDLYPGVLDLLAVEACPAVAPVLHGYYATGKPTMARALTPEQVRDLDEFMGKLLGSFREMCDALHKAGVSRADKRQAIRDLLRRNDYRVRSHRRPPLPHPPPMTRVAEDDPQPLMSFASGAIYDRRSGLLWTRGPEGTWDEGAAWAKVCPVDGGGWSLPSCGQLGTLCETPGVPQDRWVWTSDLGGTPEYARCGHLDGRAQRAVHKTWYREIWLVKRLTAAQVAARLARLREATGEGGGR